MALPSYRLALIFACLTVRSAAAYAASIADGVFGLVFGIIAIVIGLGFWVIWLTGSRKTGVETFGEKIWWDKLRPLHGTLWLVAGSLLVFGSDYAWIPLTADVTIGALAFYRQHS